MSKAEDIARSVERYFEADDDEMVDNLSKDIESYAKSQLQELREWLEKQQKQSLEAVKDSVTDSEQEFFHGCRQMAKDTLDKLDNLNG